MSVKLFSASLTHVLQSDLFSFPAFDPYARFLGHYIYFSDEYIIFPFDIIQGSSRSAEGILFRCGWIWSYYDSSRRPDVG